MTGMSFDRPHRGLDRLVLARPDAPVGPALHFCRFPVPAPSRGFPEIVLPLVERFEYTWGALARHDLILPDGMASVTWSIPPVDGVDLGAVLWLEDPQSPLLLPIEAIRERRFRAEWGVGTFCTPSLVASGVEVTALTHAAWAVLCAAPLEPMCRLLTEVALTASVDPWSRSIVPRWIQAMDLPSNVRIRLTGLVESGNPLFFAAAIQWVIRELAAAPETERREWSQWDPEPGSDQDIARRIWFPRFGSGHAPTVGEGLVAAWVLQEMFHGGRSSAGRSASADELLGSFTSLAYGQERPGDWASTLDRWLMVWSTPDDHPSVQEAPRSPTYLRELHSDSLGLDVLEWLRGVWMVSMRWWMALSGTGPPMTGGDQDLWRFAIDDRELELSPAFRVCFMENCVSTFDEFLENVRSEPADNYVGIGSLDQHDSLVCRNRPVIEFSDGARIPLGLDLLASRASSLQRFTLTRALGGVRAAASHLGPLFEAYVIDLLRRLSPRHQVFDSQQLDQVSGREKHCDALVAHGSDYLAVEISVQTVRRDVAAGDIAAIDGMARRYISKAEQARTTLASLPRVSSRLGAL